MGYIFEIFIPFSIVWRFAEVMELKLYGRESVPLRACTMESTDKANSKVAEISTLAMTTTLSFVLVGSMGLIASVVGSWVV